MLLLKNRIRRLQVRERSLTRYFDHIRDRLGILPNHHVQVEFCSVPRIRALKEAHYGYRETTDCVSFPTLFDDLPEDVEQFLGEIFICPETVRRQASRMAHAFGRECLFVFTHGLLHLVGRDDSTPDQRQAMFAEQESLMASGGFARGPWPFGWERTSSREPGTRVRRPR